MFRNQLFIPASRAPDKMHIFISIIPISSLNPMFDHLLESSLRDDSNKLSNIGFGEEMTLVEFVEVHFTHLFWSSVYQKFTCRFCTVCLSWYIPAPISN